METKWIFKFKRSAKNKKERFKARLVAKSYNQEQGKDYEVTFASKLLFFYRLQCNKIEILQKFKILEFPNNQGYISKNKKYMKIIYY